MNLLLKKMSSTAQGGRFYNDERGGDGMWRKHFFNDERYALVPVPVPLGLPAPGPVRYDDDS